MNRTNGETKKS
jgi:hypothetical protein